MGLLLWSLLLSTIGTVATVSQFYASVGGSALIFPSSTPNPDHRIDWNLDIDGAVIVTQLPYSSPTYNGRCATGACTLYANGSLQIDQLIAIDNRTYSVSFQAGGVLIKEQVQLIVYDPLTPPSVIVSTSIRPVHGDSLNLMCDAGTQTVHRVYFYRNDILVSCTSHLSCSSSSVYLYFTPILGSDTGYYTCGIENPVSSSRSSWTYLDVAVPVSGVTLRSNVSGPVIAEQEAVSLLCSSSGTEVSYNWTLKGLPLPQSPRYTLTSDDANLVISPVSRSDQGTFTCEVSNYLNSQRSNPLNLTWSPEGNIECGAERLGQRVQLSCLWPGGYPPAAVHLMYQNTILSGSDLSTTIVQTSQLPLGTQLSCTGSHAGSNQVCSLVIDIPRSAGFINDSIKKVSKGDSAVLSVTLNSGGAQDAQIFPAKFSWVRLDPSPSKLFTMNDVTIMSDDYSSYLIILDMSEDFSGEYRCNAENTMGSNSFTFILNVKEEENLSAGAIAGIVIGSIVALALVILVFTYICKKKKKSKRNESFPTSHQKKEEEESTIGPTEIPPNNYFDLDKSGSESERTTESNKSTQALPGGKPPVTPKKPTDGVTAHSSSTQTTNKIKSPSGIVNDYTGKHKKVEGSGQETDESLPNPLEPTSDSLYSTRFSTKKFAT
ncbi:V-set and immunoglobulin domain-containing protein 10-like isoform 1-T2 [Anomaloglossus baeobatrachus]|uniref:V-set and immunoglobulin domain-containing protein 10-like n=1 Tax=Anomaloglossus baeobatrachus TaxID=238106 RepID=UPI003F4FF5B3